MLQRRKTKVNGATRRTASVAESLDRMVDLGFPFDPVAGATFLSELNRLMERLRREDKGTGTVRTRRAASRRRLGRDGEAITHRPPRGLRPRPLLTVLVGADTPEGVCELGNGTVIAPGQVVPLLSEADLERVVFDGPDRVISVSRKRTFTGALRRAIEVRDRHCQHPSGCDEPADRCDVDHIQPHGHGGETTRQRSPQLLAPQPPRTASNAHPPDSTNDQQTAGPNSDQSDEFNNRAPPDTSCCVKQRLRRSYATPKPVLRAAIECAVERPTTCRLRRYRRRVPRVVMFLKSAGPAEVAAPIEGIASSFKASADSQPITRSVGSLMGSGSQGRRSGLILEADFPTLEDAMTALDAEHFQDVKATTETLTSAIFLFEVGKV